MVMNRLQETARHYANLAEQYRTELVEEQQLNEDLLGLVEALCEELGIDVEALLEDVMDVKAKKATQASLDKLANAADRAAFGDDAKKSIAATDRWSRAEEKAEKREKSSTKYTAKGGRIVKKKVIKKK
jgi:energy-converting hydrogenase A subunit M